MYACGLRVSEAVDLKMQDIDLESGILTTTGKGSKTRRVPVGTSAVEWLKAYFAPRRKNENIEVQNMFVTPAGKPLNRQVIYELVRNYGEKAGSTAFRPTLCGIRLPRTSFKTVPISVPCSKCSGTLTFRRRRSTLT